MALPTVSTHLDKPADPRAVALVARVSSDKQDSARQIEGVGRLAASRFPALPTAEFFEDVGISAYKEPIFERPQGRALIAAIKRGEIRAVLADELSRLCRGRGSEWAQFYELCTDHGVEIVTRAEGEITGQVGEVLSGLLNWKNRQESEDKIHRIKDGVRQKAREGKWPYGQKPFAYRLDPETRVLVAKEAEAEIVRTAFRRFDRGDSVLAIARDLGQAPENVRNWLDNPVYIGLIKCGDEYVEGQHAPLIDRELWERVRRRRRENAATQARYPRVQPYGSLLRCNKCRCPTNFHRADARNSYYRCESPKCRAYVAIPEYVDAAVLFGLAAVGLTVSERLDDPTWTITAPNTEDLKAVEAELARIASAHDAILELLTDGTLSAQEAKPRLNRLAVERDQYEAARAHLADDGRQLRSDLEQLLAIIGARVEGELTDERIVGRLIAWWGPADIETRAGFLFEILARIDIEHDSLRLTFRAGLALSVPLKTGRRDPNYTKPLLALGLGRPSRGPPPALSLTLETARVARALCRFGVNPK